MRCSQQAESSAIRFPIESRSSLQDGNQSMYTLKSPVCIPMINWRSVNLRSALESFSQSSRSEERGAVRFLLWWLFLHRRLRSGNEAQLSLNRFCSLRRVLASGCHSFLFEWLEKVSQPSLAEPFGSEKGVTRIDSRLSFLSLGRYRTDCRSLCRSRRPQPSRQGVYTPGRFFDQLFVCFILRAR